MNVKQRCRGNCKTFSEFRRENTMDYADEVVHRDVLGDILSTMIPLANYYGAIEV